MAFLPQNSYILVVILTLLAYAIWTVAYRLIFHPLAKIPGPLLPRLTAWHECYYDLFLGGQHPWALKKIHERHGPIIRPVPDEVHIIDPEFLDTIYATRNRNNPATGGLMVDQSIGGAEEYTLHKIRRDALNPHFSNKNVFSLEPLLSAKRDKLIAIFDNALESKQPLNISDAVFGFSNDIVRAFSFGSDNGLLDDLPAAKLQRENLARLLQGIALNKQFPFVPRFLGSILPLIFGETALPPAVMDLIKFRAKAAKDIEAVLADKTNDRKGGHSVFYELRDTDVLPPSEKTVERLQDEATLLIMAGTESPAKSMGIATFYCLSHPSITTKLQSELSEARRKALDGTLPLHVLTKLPYMNAIILEANRLSFGVTRRLVRYSPNETLSYTASYGPHKGTTYYFPPRTKMSCVTLCTHTNETLFPDPWIFDPERWLTKEESGMGSTAEEVHRRKRSMMAMGKGHRVCLGMHLAVAEMSLMLEALARFDMKLYDTDEDDVRFQHDYQISHPRLDTKGVRVEITGRNKD